MSFTLQFRAFCLVNETSCETRDRDVSEPHRECAKQQSTTKFTYAVQRVMVENRAPACTVCSGAPVALHWKWRPGP